MSYTEFIGGPDVWKGNKNNSMFFDMSNRKDGASSSEKSLTKNNG